MTVGERIKAARKNAGMTQKELADKLNISYVGVSQWENNLRNPKFETLQRIADALDTEVNIFISGQTLEQRDQAMKDYVAKRFNEAQLMTAFNKLNDKGQQVAVERVEELTKIPDYQRAEEE